MVALSGKSSFHSLAGWTKENLQFGSSAKSRRIIFHNLSLEKDEKLGNNLHSDFNYAFASLFLSHFAVYNSNLLFLIDGLVYLVNICFCILAMHPVRCYLFKLRTFPCKHVEEKKALQIYIEMLLIKSVYSSCMQSVELNERTTFSLV